jgi:hypothetical protein
MFSPAFSVPRDTESSTPSADLTREIKSISAQNQRADVFRHCPKCDSSHFTQRASRPTA